MIPRRAPLQTRTWLLPLLAILASSTVHANPVSVPYEPLPDDYGVQQVWFIILAIAVEFGFLRLVLNPERPKLLLKIVIAVHLVSYPITVVLAFFSVFVAEIAAVAIEYFLYRQIARRLAKPEEMSWRKGTRSRWIEVVLLANILSFVAGVVVLASLHGLTRERIGRRPSVARVKADTRSLSVAIDSYMLDWHTWPANQGVLRGPDIVYIGKTLSDPFSPYSHDLEGEPYRYVATRDKWLLWSAGPDRDYDLTSDNVIGLLNRITSGTVGPRHVFAPFTYDPTNGSGGSGDVWRIRQ